MVGDPPGRSAGVEPAAHARGIAGDCRPSAVGLGWWEDFGRSRSTRLPGRLHGPRESLRLYQAEREAPRRRADAIPEDPEHQRAQGARRRRRPRVGVRQEEARIARIQDRGVADARARRALRRTDRERGPAHGPDLRPRRRTARRSDRALGIAALRAEDPRRKDLGARRGRQQGPALRADRRRGGRPEGGRRAPGEREIHHRGRRGV